MKRKLIKTGDGSVTIQLEDWKEQYHSKHGAIEEAKHVFIRMGLETQLHKKEIQLLEIGFGTGLNAFISYLELLNYDTKVHYTGIEAYPVVETEWRALNYVHCLDATVHQSIFEAMHEAPWEENLALSSHFKLIKSQLKFEEISAKNTYDLVYFDAFGARVQPELWTEVIFDRMFQAMKSEGVLVTYAAKGSVRRAMQEVGFTVERLPGPPGKREMLRATKKE
ncbi:MAG: tRNA (5-methylaminomethyl-2-thiouridine)(34)-methyltransferase MnmD [Flavobacteriaceae bacterium]|nr:tRNA (5-methylaminomethyl-2-thiouridine)(34)-methyltransferase MnmD [Flavobacteriaceae bacterium]